MHADVERKIVVAITGASGSVYARMVLDELLAAESKIKIGLIFSNNGKAVSQFERQTFPLSDPRITVYENDDMFSAPASGSSGFDSMIIVPCSMGTLGRIATGVSCDLISRTADVMLKERRTLVLVPRECPLSTLHLANMHSLSQMGAVIAPASPAFYNGSQDLDSLCRQFAKRILTFVGINSGAFVWGE